MKQLLVLLGLLVIGVRGYMDVVMIFFSSPNEDEDSISQNSKAESDPQPKVISKGDYEWDLMQLTRVNYDHLQEIPSYRIVLNDVMSVNSEKLVDFPIDPVKKSAKIDVTIQDMETKQDILACRDNSGIKAIKIGEMVLDVSKTLWKICDLPISDQRISFEFPLYKFFQPLYNLRIEETIIEEALTKPNFQLTQPQQVKIKFGLKSSLTADEKAKIDSACGKNPDNVHYQMVVYGTKSRICTKTMDKLLPVFVSLKIEEITVENSLKKIEENIVFEHSFQHRLTCEPSKVAINRRHFKLQAVEYYGLVVSVTCMHTRRIL